MELKRSTDRGRKSPRVRGGSEELAHEIRQLPTIALTALRRKWTAVFGFDPSPRLGRVLMVRAIAYRLQERAFGGLKPSAQRILDRVSDGPQKKVLKRRASAGTVLIRVESSSSRWASLSQTTSQSTSKPPAVITT